MEKKLLQVNMAQEAFTQLEELKNKTGLSTITEVVKYSISVFKWIVDMQKKGYQIYAVPEDGNPELEKEKAQLLIPV
jgi:hypothetical protein